MKGRIFMLTADPPEQGGGVEHLVRELATGLEKRNYDVTVFHRGNSSPRAWRAPASRLGRQVRDTLLGYFVGRAAGRQLDDGVAATISHGPIGWFPTRRRNRPVRQIHFYHGTYRGQAEAIRPLVTRKGYLKLKWWDAMLLEKWSGRGKLCLCNSEQTREEVQRFFGHDGVTVWYPLDTARFHPLDQRACRQELGLAAEGPVGLFAGSTEPTKGFPVVRGLMREFPQVHWLLALRGGVPEDLRGKKGVTVFESAGHGRMPQLYNAADFSVCPSRYESFGYVVAEALACGTPVVASPGGASRLFLQEGPLARLLIASADDLAGFCGAVSELLREGEAYRAAVLEKVRPRLEGLLARENWWRRFSEVTGL